MNKILQYLPTEAAREIEPIIDSVREIRLMSTGVAAAVTDGGTIRLSAEITPVQLKNTLNYICRGAAYSSQHSLCEGYVTIEGGHRVGVCGRIATGSGGAVMLEPSALCFRVARQIVGAAEKIEKHLGGNILIISPPGCGKTTILRDAARILGNRVPVCIVDERSEIAAVYRGVPQMDIGTYSCVLDGVNKADGILMALRAMSPRVIVTDEIGSDRDTEAIYSLINAGVKIAASVHGYSKDDVYRRGALGELIASGIFDCIAVLRGRGELKEVYSNA